MTRAKGPCVHFSDRPYQLWLFHLPLYQVPESQKELGSIMLHKHWTNRKHSLNQYYEQHQAQTAKGALLSPIRSSLLFPCHSLPGTELRLETSCNVSVWPEQAVEKDGRAWVPHCTTQCKSHVLVNRCRAKSILNTYGMIGLRCLIELRVAFIWVLLRNNTRKILFSFSSLLLHRLVSPIPSLRL